MTPVYEYAGILILTGITSLHLQYSLISSVGWVKGNTHAFSFVNGDPNLTEDADGEAAINMAGNMNSKKSHRFLLTELPFFLLPLLFPSIHPSMCMSTCPYIDWPIHPSIQVVHSRALEPVCLS